MEIIAEIGKNFINISPGKCNDIDCVDLFLNNAKELVRKAKESGATVVKFQTHVFQDEQLKRDESRYDWINFNEIVTPKDKFWIPLKEYCDELGIEFITTPMSKMAAMKVNDLVDRWKIGSADITDIDLLMYLKDTGKPIIISTGMSTQKQVDDVVKLLGKQIQYINYCVSLYPCPIYKIDLSMLSYLKERYDLPVGFSDHSLSIEAPALAVRMGAVAIEKHFTLDRNAYGPDHKVSLLPDEFKKMVRLCKKAETEGESFEEERKHWKTFRK